MPSELASQTFAIIRADILIHLMPDLSSLTFYYSAILSPLHLPNKCIAKGMLK
jgi:hypothetical protein